MQCDVSNMAISSHPCVLLPCWIRPQWCCSLFPLAHCLMYILTQLTVRKWDGQHPWHWHKVARWRQFSQGKILISRYFLISKTNFVSLVYFRAWYNFKCNVRYNLKTKGGGGKTSTIQVWIKVLDFRSDVAVQKFASWGIRICKSTNWEPPVVHLGHHQLWAEQWPKRGNYKKTDILPLIFNNTAAHCQTKWLQAVRENGTEYTDQKIGSTHLSEDEQDKDHVRDTKMVWELHFGSEESNNTPIHEKNEIGFGHSVLNVII